MINPENFNDGLTKTNPPKYPHCENGLYDSLLIRGECGLESGKELTEVKDDK